MLLWYQYCDGNLLFYWSNFGLSLPYEEWLSRLTFFIWVNEMISNRLRQLFWLYNVPLGLMNFWYLGLRRKLAFYSKLLGVNLFRDDTGSCSFESLDSDRNYQLTISTKGWFYCQYKQILKPMFIKLHVHIYMFNIYIYIYIYIYLFIFLCGS